MNIKRIAITSAALSVLLMNTAHAQSGFQNTLNTALGSTFGASDCIVCHVGGLSGSTATTAIARTWLAVGANTALLASTDSDGDGFTNKQEASGITVDFNNIAVTPFTKAAIVSATALTDTVLPNFIVQGDSAATAQLFTDPYALATPGTTEVLGTESLTINIAPVDVYYKSAGVDATVTLYMVDPYGQGTVSPMGTGWTANADGSLHIVALPAGATSVTGVVVRVTPTALPNNGGDNDSNDNDSNDDDDEKNAVTCAGVISTTPLWMLFALLSLGFFIRKKSD